MGLTLDFTDDYLCYDNPEAVVVEQPRHGAASVEVQAPVVFRFTINTGERMASGGAYQGSDVVWLVPRRTMPDDFDLSPGDVIIPTGGQRFTVLDRTFDQLDGMWQANARNLALHYGLRDRIDIQRADISYDAAGAAVKKFPPDGGRTIYKNLLAKVQTQRGDIEDQRGIRGTVVKTDVIVEKQLDLGTDVNEWRIVWGAEILDIKAYRQTDRIDELPVIEAELRP